MKNKIKPINEVLFSVKENKLFSGINIENIIRITGIGKISSYNKNDIIYRALNEDDKIYLVFSGKVRLSAKNSQHEIKSVYLERNDFFGHYELLENKIRRSFAIAAEDSILIILTKSEIDLLIEKEDGIINNLHTSFFEFKEKIIQGGDIKPNFFSVPTKEDFNSTFIKISESSFDDVPFLSEEIKHKITGTSEREINNIIASRDWNKEFSIVESGSTVVAFVNIMYAGLKVVPGFYSGVTKAIKKETKKNHHRFNNMC